MELAGIENRPHQASELISKIGVDSGSRECRDQRCLIGNCSFENLNFGRNDNNGTGTGHRFAFEFPVTRWNHQSEDKDGGPNEANPVAVKIHSGNIRQGPAEAKADSVRLSIMLDRSS